MTYTEYLTKVAKEQPSDYEMIAKRLETGGNSAVNSAMATPTSGEFGWSLAGAGLGAGGAYLLSRRLRRNGTRKQRALDTVVGALIGLAGTQMILSGTADKNSGLSLRQQMRADKFLESIGLGDRDHAERTNVTTPLEWNENTMIGTGAGVIGGGILGGVAGPFADITERRYVNKAKANKLPSSRVAAAGKRGRFWGNIADIFSGAGLGGALGFGGGVVGNIYSAKQTDTKYGGGF